MSIDRIIDLLPVDPEIERTFRQRKRQVNQRRTEEMNFENINQGNGANLVQNPILIADDRDRALRQYAIPVFDDLNPGIRRPEIEAQQFELKPVMFQMLQTVGQFSRMTTEDPHLHLRMFMEVSESFQLAEVPEDALRLKLFPYSLRDRARAWLNSLPSNSISTWQELTERFLVKYFLPSKIAKLRNGITTFQKMDDESLYKAWERFKELLRKCPHHGIPHCIQLEKFYNGLNAHTRMVVDASANGAILSKSYNEAYEIIERIASNNYQWPTNRATSGRRVVGIHKVDAFTSLASQVSSISSMLKNLTTNRSNSFAVQPPNQYMNIACVYYGEGHVFEECPSNPESMYYIGNQNQTRGRQGLQSKFYKPSWRNHPNLSWNNQGARGSNNYAQPRPTQWPSFSQQVQKSVQAESSNSLENLLKAYMAKNDATLRNLENQVGQLVIEFRNRPQGALPSDTKNLRNPGKEHCKALTLRSGKTVEPNIIEAEKEHAEAQDLEEVQPSVEVPVPLEPEPATPEKVTLEPANFDQPTNPLVVELLPKTNQPVPTSVYKPPPPYPQRLQKQKQEV
ncbi:hypothetical protein CXB51_014478 [Gossypium anomalum]|uniref:Retrotransposon gag domain-containing protein n=1 Tax=Gossypium anomalum TaxID=47600 RepID=A0A8J5YXQ7_9ROSI|nr:hypothetical protein CXB51_014478 [Gossypium anomalum]